MAVHLTILLLLSGLTGSHSIKTVSKVSVEAGKSISIPCRYEPKYRRHVKYLCEGYRYSSCEYGIKTNQVQRPGRFSISDDTNDRVFTVTIKQQKTQELDLWCVVEIDNGGDVPEYFQLSVIRGKPRIQVKDQKLTGFIGGSISIHCNSSESKEMKWCRLDGSCVTGSSGSIDGAAVIINTTVPNVAIVTMSDLQPGSGGWYWCATKTFQMPVNLTVTKTPTTTIGGEVVTTVENKQLSMTRFELMFLIIPLSLLILIVIITLVVWILLKRKHTKAEACTTTENEDEVTYSSVVHTQKSSSQTPNDDRQVDVVYSSVVIKKKQSAKKGNAEDRDVTSNK